MRHLYNFCAVNKFMSFKENNSLESQTISKGTQESKEFMKIKALPKLMNLYDKL